MLGSYYIVNGVVIYNTIDSGLGHPFFWKEIVKKYAIGYDNLTLTELMVACYATDRGRVTESLLVGTPDSQKLLSTLQDVFGLQDYPADFKDDHYKIMAPDANLLAQCPLTLPDVKIIRYLGGRFV